jgi:hypothetical protein
MASTKLFFRKHTTMEIDKHMKLRAWHLHPVFHVD